jgi:hypothetical protein
MDDRGETDRLEQGYRVAASAQWEEAVSQPDSPMAMADLLRYKAEEAEWSEKGWF